MSTDRERSQSFWDRHYTRHPDTWSGAPNAVLVDETDDLRPGSTLDLGRGEGGDAIWLAQRGWRVAAVDVSSVVLSRAAGHARSAGVADGIVWKRHDLDATFPVGSFDLVTAHYLHSLDQVQHDGMLNQAVQSVARGGALLLVGHTSVAPWSWDQHATFPGARERSSTDWNWPPPCGGSRPAKTVRGVRAVPMARPPWFSTASSVPGEQAEPLEH